MTSEKRRRALWATVFWFILNVAQTFPIAVIIASANEDVEIGFLQLIGVVV
jgi:hypothetical protein